MADETSGWYGLVSINREIADRFRQEQNDRPTACPHDGEPLTTGPHGELFCPFDGWRWTGVRN